jgi:hypothetical protein
MQSISVTVFIISETFFSPQNERERLYLLTRVAGAFSSSATYSAEDLLAAINGQHQFVDVPFYPTFFLRRMWDGMATTLRAHYQSGRVGIRRRSVLEFDYSDYLVPPAVVFRLLLVLAFE